MEEKCRLCGKKARYISKRYVSPLCKECAMKEAIKIGTSKGIDEKFIELEDYYTQPCKEMEDIVKEYSIDKG